MGDNAVNAKPDVSKSSLTHTEPCGFLICSMARSKASTSRIAISNASSFPSALRKRMRTLLPPNDDDWRSTDKMSTPGIRYSKPNFSGMNQRLKGKCGHTQSSPSVTATHNEFFAPPMRVQKLLNDRPDRHCSLKSMLGNLGRKIGFPFWRREITEKAPTPSIQVRIRNQRMRKYSSGMAVGRSAAIVEMLVCIGVHRRSTS